MFNTGMKTSKEIRLENARQLMRDAGGQVQLCEIMGKSQSQLSTVLRENPGKGIGDLLAREFEEKFGKEKGWMDNLHGPKEIGEPGSSYGVSNGNVMIPLMNSEGSMGSGRSAPEHEEIIDHLTLRKSWLMENFTVSGMGNLRLTTGFGDSMAETIKDGDIIVVDIGVKEIRMDAIFVLEREGELFIKRIQRMLDGSFLVISDNKKAYDPYPLTLKDFSNIRVCGRALMVWNGRKL